MSIKLEPLVLTKGERETMILVSNINTIGYLVDALDEVVSDIDGHIPGAPALLTTFKESLEAEVGKIQHLLVKTEDILE